MSSDQRQAIDTFEICLEGAFDLSERTRLLDAFAIASHAPTVILNLTKATFVDSTVLQCMVAFNTATQARGARLVLTGLNDNVQRLFTISGLHAEFQIQLPNISLGPVEMRRLTIEASSEV